MARSEHAKERTGRKKGRRFEVLENKDGAKYEIRYVQGDEIFYTAPEPRLEFWSSDVTEVRKELTDYMREHDSLVFEPIIEVDRRPFDNSNLGLDYARKFRAKKVNGEWVYRSFSVDTDVGIPKFEGADWPDVVEGKAGGISCPDNSATVLKYTPERWTFLRNMTHRIKALKRAMKAFINQGEAELVEVLEGRKVFNPTVTHLLAAPGDSQPDGEDD